MRCAHQGDPAGSWYDAALPNREAFCMRDVSHQAIAGGLMGIEPAETEGRVATLSRLTEPVSWAEIGHVPLHGNEIDVRHNGRMETVLTNQSGKTITSIARFYGTGRIEANARAIDTRVGKDDVGEPLVWAEVPVAAGESRTARRIAP